MPLWRAVCMRGTWVIRRRARMMSYVGETEPRLSRFEVAGRGARGSTRGCANRLQVVRSNFHHR